MFVATARMLMLERLVSANDSCALAAVALLQTHKLLFKLLSIKIHSRILQGLDTWSNRAKNGKELNCHPTFIQLHYKNRTCSTTRFTTGAERKEVRCCWSSIVSASECSISAARVNVRFAWRSSPCFRYISPSSTQIDHSSPGTPTSSATRVASCRCAIVASISP